MIHVREIRMMIDQCDFDEADLALQNLLDLGPNNTEALKLRAYLFSQKGLFDQEDEMWRQVIDIDSEDEDAINYLFRRHMEERENFYFTDELVGGRRFLADPKSLVRYAAIGAFGCLGFLVLHAQKQTLAHIPMLSLSVFIILVAIPLFLLVFTFFKSLKGVTVTQDGLSLITRLKTHKRSWEDIESVFVAYELLPNDSRLSMIFMPKDAHGKILELDLGAETSSIHGRAFFINELRRYYGDIVYVNRPEIELKGRSILNF